MEEIWKDIKGYENHYQVSNLGRVRSVEYQKESKGKTWFAKGKLLTPHDGRRGYLQIFLYNKGVRKMFYIHRLVAQAFIPNPNGFTVINHKDENGHNNIVSNLEWCTPEYNYFYGTRIQRIAEQSIGRGGFPIILLDHNGDIVKEYPSVSYGSKMMGVTEAPVRRCAIKNSEIAVPKYTIKGYIIKFKEI